MQKIEKFKLKNNRLLGRNLMHTHSQKALKENKKNSKIFFSQPLKIGYYDKSSDPFR